MRMPTLEESFAGVTMRVSPERAIDGRFIVLAKAPTTFGAEVELCRVQYLPHALAIAALPEMVDALIKSGAAVTAFIKRDVGRDQPPEASIAGEAVLAAIMKAETYEL